MPGTLRWALLACGLALLAPCAAGHGVEEGDASFVSGNEGLAVGPYMYLGAKHMVTGYDHLLFLVGVVFFLYRLRDVVLYVSMFTLGHSATLLAGVLADVHANARIVDAIIGLSIVYKAFDNLGGFRTVFGAQPNAKAAVLAFGLAHGFGLATKLQDLAPSGDGLVGNLLAFNVGVELGQVLALGAIVLALDAWRRSPSYLRQSFLANLLLMAAGFTLAGEHVAGYLLEA